ncbi:unnamed protein product [Agarophyton chilense]
MGKRKGRTGAGGAVVSSLSRNPGGTIRNRGDEESRGSSTAKSRREDQELNELAQLPAKGKRNAAPSSSSTASSSGGPSSRWLGKSPQQMLREWCIKNNRKRPYFSKMSNSELMRCTVPPGRKDGKPVKGLAFARIIGIGQKPGDEYAALNVLHQVERGKPLERLLAPEYREVWLSLDDIFEEVQQNQEKRAMVAEQRKEKAQRRSNFERNKESATISISSASRQLIEDVLLEQKSSEQKELSLPNEGSKGKEGMGSISKLRKELLQQGFAELDATDASQRFENMGDALDYLCLNLDEAELPAKFVAKADVEVVQFYSKESAEGPRRVNSQRRDELCSYLCLSRYAAEKALKRADGDFESAFCALYETLTQRPFTSNLLRPGANEAIVSQWLSDESESLSAIYAEDIRMGSGVFPAFSDRWSAVVRVPDGFPALQTSTPAFVVFVDMIQQYPFSAPAVLVLGRFDGSDEERDSLTSAQKRLLMRAAAGKISEMYDTVDKSYPSASKDPVLCVHEVLTLICHGTVDELLSFATTARKEKGSIEICNPHGSEKYHYRRQHPQGSKKSTKTKVERILPAAPQTESRRLREMKKQRQTLPAHDARNEILSALDGHQVVVISGATGSGKTTQVPQFILEEATKNQIPVSIVCTQPRRIAAMSVAERVASERCEAVGESVGYQVKLNSRRSAKTRLVFCTTGVLLRRLQSDPLLQSISHVIIDEVHERSSETDFLMLIIRDMLQLRPNLRVILMSATLEAEKFAAYFSNVSVIPASSPSQVPVVSIAGRTFPVEEYYLEDVIKLTGYSLKPGNRYAKKRWKPPRNTSFQDNDGPCVSNHRSATELASVDDPSNDDFSDGGYPPDDKEMHIYETGVRLCTPEAKDPPANRRTATLIDESIVNFDLIDMLVRYIDIHNRKQDKDGAILIFLPGSAEISTMVQRLSMGPQSNQLWPLPLHSLLSPDDQSKVFCTPPKGKRKVICSTNIAETSITINDVTEVIDTLRAKESSYDALNGSSVLQECFISRASAKQRAGRAGRVSKGVCYRLIRRYTFENKLAAQQKPEIRRVALEHLVLNVLSIVPKDHRTNNPHAFFSRAIDPPDDQSVSTAVANLIDIGALKKLKDEEGGSNFGVQMTALGKHLAGIPVDAKIGKLLVYGSLFSCLDATLTMAATVSERSPFYSPFGKREESRAAKAKFKWGKSDLLTYVHAFNRWRELRESGCGFSAEQNFCSQHFLSRKTLLTIADGRSRLADVLKDIGFAKMGAKGRGWERAEDLNQHDQNLRVLRAVICAALYPNIVRIDLPEKKYREVAGGAIPVGYNSKDLKLRTKNYNRVFLHPESTNFHVGNYETRWLAYYEKVCTSKLFIRDATMVSPYAILLFGGEIGVSHKNGQMSVDRWVLFRAPAQVAVLARELRRKLDQLLLRKFENIELDINREGSKIFSSVSVLLLLAQFPSFVLRGLVEYLGLEPRQRIT